MGHWIKYLDKQFQRVNSKTEHYEEHFLCNTQSPFDVSYFQRLSSITANMNDWILHISDENGTFSKGRRLLYQTMIRSKIGQNS